MTAITKRNDKIVLENNHVQIVLSDMDASVLQIVDKATGKDIRGERTYFF